MPQSPSEGILRSDPTEAYGVRPLGEIADAFVSYVTLCGKQIVKKGGGEVGDLTHKKVLPPLWMSIWCLSLQK